LEHENTILQATNDGLSAELDTERTRHEECRASCKSWEKKYTEHMVKTEEDFRELNEQMERYKGVQEDIQHLQIKFDAERAAFETQVQQLSGRAEDVREQAE